MLTIDKRWEYKCDAHQEKYICVGYEVLTDTLPNQEREALQCVLEL